MQLAEDVVQDTFIKAIENWAINGLPDNPAAWLFTVARNKATDVVRKQQKQKQQFEAYGLLMQSEYSLAATIHTLVNDRTLDDDRLQMMFVCCHPLLSSEASITLILKTICGLTVTEIASAFLTGYDTIEKRLYRAKQTFRENKIPFELPAETVLEERLERVLTCIYLLFNEGYYSTTGNQVLRKDLCSEALQLAVLLTEFESTNLPKTNALVALMCYHSSRFPARENAANGAVTLDEQERHLWDRDLIKAGSFYLSKAAEGNEITSYHLEARIAFCHAELTADKEKWPEILKAYDMLIEINNSPGVIINRIYAIYRVHGAMAALEETDKYYNVRDSHYYYTLLGELYLHVDKEKARSNFLRALSLARSAHDKQMLQYKIDRLKGEP